MLYLSDTKTSIAFNRFWEAGRGGVEQGDHHISLYFPTTFCTHCQKQGLFTSHRGVSQNVWLACGKFTLEQTLESETKEIILGKVESRQCLKTFFPGGVIK